MAIAPSAVQNEINQARSLGLLPAYKQAAKDTGISVPVLLAKDSRESRLTLALSSECTGDGGYGHGISQIDSRFWEDFTSEVDACNHEKYLWKGARILSGYVENVRTEAREAGTDPVRAGLAAYNTGVGSVLKALRNGFDVDRDTTGQDYSRDVMERAAQFKEAVPSGGYLEDTPDFDPGFDPAFGATFDPEPSEDEGPDPEDIDLAPGGEDFDVSSNVAEVLREMGVDPTSHEVKEDTAQDLGGGLLEGKLQPLAGYPEPEEGEMDIGDLRFGSVKFDEIDPSDLNQPSSINQQNAGTIASVPMLRTDMNPVLQDNSALPETVVTLSVNASQRDDINDRLRPLVAMHRRMPFCAVRNGDLARMFLGIGTSGSTVDRLSKLFPSLSDEEARQRAEEIDEINPSSVWVPVTMRSLSVQSQPGTADLYRVHLVLRYANHQPYVPRMQFWESTEQAVKWARYLSLRSEQGSTVLDVDLPGPSGTARVETKNGDVALAEPPVAGAGSEDSNQTLSPHRSYPFKKFYRGLLEEYQPEPTGGSADRLAEAAPIGKAGPGTAGPDTEGVYEPAYPIKDPARLLERSDPQAEIGLRYRLVTQGTSRDARRQRLAQAFQEQIDFADRLNASAQLLKTNQGLGGMKELGKISPYVIGPGQKVGAALLGISVTADALQGAIEDATTQVKQNQENLKEEIGEYYFDPNTEDNLSQRDSELTLTGDLGRDIVRSAQFMDQGGAVSFGIPSPEYEDIFVPFTDQIQKLQKGVVRKYADILGYLDENLEGERQEKWERFLDRQRRKYAEERGLDVPDAEDLLLAKFSPVATDRAPAEALQQGFRSYMLSYPFVKALAEQAWMEGIEKDGRPVRRQLEDLSSATAELSTSIHDTIKNNQDAVLSEVRGGETDDRRGFLDLSRSTIESVQLRFTNRFGDKEWDAYPNAVSQHIGGGNAEVTLEINTDDKLLRDQLGQIKRSQEAMSQLRETQDMVPALIDVFGEGNFLRAHGIKRLAYRSHTVTMAENQPGTYQIRLELVQDEATLKRAEKFRKVSSTSERFKPGPVEPLVVPSSYSGEQNMPVGWLLNNVYSERVAREVNLHSKGGETIYPKRFYHGTAGGADVFDLTEEKRPIAINCEYVLPEDRDSEFDFFDSTVTLRNPETGETFRRSAQFSQVLRPIGRYLDYAQGELSGSAFRQLVQSVNSILSTTGSTQKGLVLAWVDLAIGKLNEALAGQADEAIREPESQNNFPEAPFSAGDVALPSESPGGYQETSFEQAVGTVPDNLTLTAERAIDNNLETATLAAAARPFLQAADDLARAVADADAAREAYSGYLERRELEGWQDLQESMEEFSGQLAAASESVPTAYPDLLMREVEDPDQNVNLIAPDFPFGPGVTDLAEDRYLEDYEFADSMRQITTFKMATIGLNALDPYIEAGVPEDDQGGESRQAGVSGVVPESDPDPIAQQASQGSTSYEKVREQNTDVLKGVFNEAVEDIREEVAQGAEVPFAAGGDHFNEMMSELEEKAAFRPSVDEQLTAQDRVNVLRISRTARYVTEVIEAARQANRRSMAFPDEALSEEDKRQVEKTITALKEGNEQFFGPISKADAAQQAQNMTEVQEDPWLMRRRKEIIDLYSADPSAIAEQFGWNDRTAEPRRQKLMEKLRDTWTDWKGMRQAFPTYQLVVAGPVGSGSWETLDKLYTWTALQSLTIRDMQDNAGTYAELTLSNMRQRVMGPNGAQGPSPFREENYDTRLKLKPGTNMYVYTGYGPDAAHLQPFAGRVTRIRPGPRFAVELSSYGTTLNYPPNEGKGFYVDGSDGQATIAEAVLYTIGQTEGLEGLGSSTIGSPVDPLGRNSEGNPENAWRTTLATSVYRSIGSPGLGAALGDESAEREAVQNVLDYAAENGAQSLKKFLLGDPAVYENVYLSGSQTQANFSDVLFGGTKDLITEGKGWGWASRPNQTAWSQLKAQSKLFPDYAVTTRPYNDNVPLEDQVQGDDLRETLYFGPRDGSYIHSSTADQGSGTFARLSDETIRGIIDDNYETEPPPGASFGPDETVYGAQSRKVRGLYRQLYLKTVYLTSALSVEDAGEPTGLNPLGLTGLSEILPEWAYIEGGIEDFFGGSRFNVTDSYRTLHGRNTSTNELQSIWNEIRSAFPSTTAQVQSLLSNYPELSSSINTLTENTFSVKLDRAILKASLPLGVEEVNSKLEEAIEAEVNIEGVIVDEVDREEFQRSKESVFEAFIEDLRHLAARGQGAQNLTRNPIFSNPVVQKIRQKLLDEGYTPGQRYKPVQKHHFANTYNAVVSNQVSASANNPEFFNRVTVSWPQEPDKRMSAYLGGRGSRMSYQVQAAPTISEDFIQDRTVYYPNLSYDQAEVTRLLTSQFEEVEGGEHFEELIKRLETLNDAVKNDKTSVAHDPVNPHRHGPGAGTQTPINEALEDVQQEIRSILDRLNEIYIRPKFQTVANNYLLDGLREMYSGQMVMRGDPTIRPYHVLHLFDDVKQMHGPTEAKAVMHNFDQSGFYTVVEPQLTARLRGAGSASDVSWMSFASQYSALYTWWQRLGSGLMEGGALGARVGLYSMAASFLGNTAAGAAQRLGLTQLGGRLAVYGGATGPLFAAAAVLDLAYTALNAAAASGRENAKQYIGLVTGAMDANPVMMMPLTYRGQSYTAGLTGATGPGSLQTALEEDLNQASQSGGMGLDVLRKIRKYSNLEQQAPQ